jgi:hypothetical protein
MPTQEQADTAVRHIADLVSRRFIDGGGDMCGCRYVPEGGGNVGMTYCYPPEPGESFVFAELDERSQVDRLVTYVDWEGFSDAQEMDVIQNVIDGKEQAHWMGAPGFAREIAHYAGRHASPKDPDLER